MDQVWFLECVLMTKKIKVGFLSVSNNYRIHGQTQPFSRLLILHCHNVQHQGRKLSSRFACPFGQVKCVFYLSEPQNYLPKKSNMTIQALSYFSLSEWKSYPSPMFRRPKFPALPTLNITNCHRLISTNYQRYCHHQRTLIFQDLITCFHSLHVCHVKSVIRTLIITKK